MSSRAHPYRDAVSFRRALETRLNNFSKDKGTDLDRLRKQVAFDRLLARIFSGDKEGRWLLKGGYAMELRFCDLARATKDMDLSLPIESAPKVPEEKLPQKIREDLQDAAGLDMGDWFQYLIKAPVLELDAAPYGGARYPVEVRLAGTRFANFNLDVGVGDVVLFSPEWRQDHDWLGFAGIPSARIPLISREQQFAEKIHAYTLPRDGNPNSRTKDLVDLVLLIEQGLTEPEKIKTALQKTFRRRKTHEVPKDLPSPSENWEGPYHALAEDCGVTKKTLSEAFRTLEEFWGKIL
ncbi:MAG: nucleotidyl transferase AbiEii/AbiGii toxin family protein [Candidatus Omnitrophota bacterium]